MENRKSKITLYDIVAIGLMAAFVFIATFFFKIKIPTPGGSTMVKLGNGICLLCGTLLGGWRGGLAAGIGCALFDLTVPEYAPTAYITFIRYFIMAGLCGFIAHWHGANGRKTGRNLAATIIGAFTYSGMYIGEKIIGMMIVGSAFVPAVVGNAASIISSLTNAVVGVIVAMLLTPALRKAFQSTAFARRMEHSASK